MYVVPLDGLAGGEAVDPGGTRLINRYQNACTSKTVGTRKNREAFDSINVFHNGSWLEASHQRSPYTSGVWS
jgi:hypothetical protein